MFATTTGVNSSVAISNLRFRFLKRRDTDSSHWPSHIHYLVFILLYAWMFISILEGLPFVQKTGNSEKNLNGTVHPGGNVPEKQ